MTPRRNNNNDDDNDALGSSSQTLPPVPSSQEDNCPSESSKNIRGNSAAEPPTSAALLELCNLPSDINVNKSPDNDIDNVSQSRSTARQSRLKLLQQWMKSHPLVTRELLLHPRHRDVKTGCMPLHWAAGTGFDDALESIFLFLREFPTASLEGHDTTSCHGRQNNNFDAIVNQPAHHPSTSRTPLHYAARNGHLSTCHLLIRKYKADCHPKCGRGSVTPLQLAVWQNRLDVVQFLVEEIEKTGSIAARTAASTQQNDVVHERNGFHCGLMHWIGLVPKKRWRGDSSKSNDTDGNDNDSNDDGSGVLPLARYLHSLGISYRSTPENSNSQGHTPMHKAAWGGNLALLRYFREEHGVYDTVQDHAGNYSADIAKMRGEMEVHRWLLEEGSGDRAESYRVLGLDVEAGLEVVKRRYWELAKLHHPDRVGDGLNDGKCDNDVDLDDRLEEFIKIKAAYEHLTKDNGIGKQKNPKFDELRLLENHKRITNNINRGTNHDDTDTNNQKYNITIDHRLDESTDGNEQNVETDNVDLFMAKLIAVLSDYGTTGFPVALIARRWNQIWPDRPFPTPDEYIIERTVKIRGEETVIRKKVKLLKWLKWKCRGTNVHFRNLNGDVLAFGSLPPNS